MSKLPSHLEDRTTDGARLYSPTAARNSGPIAEQLFGLLPKDAHVLDIASGSGEQGLAICRARPDITWQPSDIDAQARASCDAWAADLPQEQMRPAKTINVLEPFDETLAGKFDALYCANMIHIAPEASVDGLSSLAAKAIKPGGQVFLYGPFLFGADSAQSNLDFSERLKSRHPDWGVREIYFVKHIFASHGLNLVSVIDMPKNNHIIRFKTA